MFPLYRHLNYFRPQLPSAFCIHHPFLAESRLMAANCAAAWGRTCLRFSGVSCNLLILTIALVIPFITVFLFSFSLPAVFGRAHVCAPVPGFSLVCRLPLEKKVSLSLS